MEKLRRNKTTASEASAIEDGKMNPFFPTKEYSEQYLKLHKERNEKLPVRSQRQEFLDKYQSEQVTIVVGDAESGKTTQLPQFVLFDEWESNLSVACTQPSRAAATSVASRVAREMDVPLGSLVGYKVRFETKTKETTRLEALTDGSLLQKYATNDVLQHYACIMIDEAHERTKDTDMLLALLKNLIPKRQDLNIVIMSAPVNIEKLCQYFGTSNIFEAKRQANAVQIKHVDSPPVQYDIAVVATVRHIVMTKPKGNILVFMTSPREIEKTCVELRTQFPGLKVLPIYSSLPKHAQDLATSGSTTQMCIVSTDVAEASLTIPGVIYVVDCGLHKEAGYNPRVGMTTVLTAPISQASARQRAGCAGRTEPGECYRLYSKEFHDRGMSPATPPAIHLSELSGEVLRLKSLGFEDIHKFDWLDPLHPEPYLRAISDLRVMGYINDQCRITPNGRKAIRFPVHCAWYNCFLKAHALGCLRQLVTIAALMSTQDDILTRPYEVRYAADGVRQAFAHGQSDILGRMNALSCYFQMSKDLSKDDLLGWCNEYFVDHKVATQVLAIREELMSQVRLHLLMGKSEPSALDEAEEGYSDKIRQSILAGFFFKAAMFEKSPDSYKTARDNHPFLLDPDSSLVGMDYEWVICHNMHYAGIQYLQYVTAVEPEWLIVCVRLTHLTLC
ncbi:pre-mrna splicing factor rna helicase [Fusarium acuminatum]|uniref:Pre-mrna splicing factor rna helicase n=1 Tax=Fusarium acuminatum TaxID=5515 RepID=A0ABZ2WR83_9HYPO